MDVRKVMEDEQYDEKAKINILNREFLNFKKIGNETITEMINRYCGLFLEMNKRNMTKFDFQWVDKLANALPREVWSGFIIKLHRIRGSEDVGFSKFIDMIEK